MAILASIHLLYVHIRKQGMEIWRKNGIISLRTLLHILRAQSITSLKAVLRQEVNRDFYIFYRGLYSTMNSVYMSSQRSDIKEVNDWVLKLTKSSYGKGANGTKWHCPQNLHIYINRSKYVQMRISTHQHRCWTGKTSIKLENLFDRWLFQVNTKFSTIHYWTFCF